MAMVGSTATLRSTIRSMCAARCGDCRSSVARRFSAVSRSSVRVSSSGFSTQPSMIWLMWVSSS
jgi:hypothetical protein